METDEEIAEYYEELKRHGKELDNLVPVKAHVDPNFGIVYSVRFAQGDMAILDKKAKEKGMKLSAFIRSAALAAAAGDLDIEAGERQAALQDVRKKAQELAKSVERLK